MSFSARSLFFDAAGRAWRSALELERCGCDCETGGFGCNCCCWAGAVAETALDTLEEIDPPVND